MTTTLRRCVGASDHRPQYLETDRHHYLPTYLCSLLGVPKRTETVDLCAGCHDRQHHFIRHLVNEGNLGGHRPSAGERVLLDTFWSWWQQVLG